MTIQVLPIVTGPFQENTFIVWDNSNKKCIIIDPGDNPERIISEIDSLNLIPKAIVNTHAHLDHIGAVDPLKDYYNIPFYLHKDECNILNNYESSLTYFGLSPKPTPKVDVWFEHENRISIDNFNIQLYKTPGHTPGGTCLIINDNVFTGDTIFKVSIGRTDLPGGDFELLSKSLKRMINEIPDTFIIYPGHGPATTLAQEKTENPYLN